MITHTLSTPIKKTYQAIGIVEVIIIIAVVSIALLALHELVAFNFDITSQGILYIKASLLAQEGTEVLRILKNQSWSSAIAPLTPGASYYPVFSNNLWSLQITPLAPIDGVFTRWVTIENVFRDANNDISSSGTLDPNTKKITVTLSWQVKNQARTIVIPTYLTNLLNN